MDAVSDVLSVLEIMDVELSLTDTYILIKDWQRETGNLTRDSENGHRSCLTVGGAGAYSWIKNRVLEMKPFRPRLYEMPPFRLTTELHFEPWNTELYGPFELLAEDRRWFVRMSQILGTSQSPLHRLHDGTPVNQVTYRVASMPHDMRKTYSLKLKRKKR